MDPDAHDMINACISNVYLATMHLNYKLQFINLPIFSTAQNIDTF